MLPFNRKAAKKAKERSSHCEITFRKYRREVVLFHCLLHRPPNRMSWQDRQSLQCYQHQWVDAQDPLGTWYDFLFLPSLPTLLRDAISAPMAPIVVLDPFMCSGGIGAVVCPIGSVFLMIVTFSQVSSTGEESKFGRDPRHPLQRSDGGRHRSYEANFAVALHLRLRDQI